MNKQAIVIVYDGAKPGPTTRASIVDALINTCAVESVKIYHLEEEEIVAAIVASTVTHDTTQEKQNVCIDVTPEDHAVIYLGTEFADFIKEGLSAFSARLSVAYTLAKLQYADEKLCNAIEIIGNGKFSNVSAKTSARYGFGILEFNMVKNLYRSCQERLGK